MGRQYEQRFNPGYKENGDDNQRDHFPDPPHNAGDEHQRHESDNIGEDTIGDWHSNIFSALNGCLDMAEASLSVLVDIFSGDDGIIDNNTKCNNKGEH